MANGNAGGAQNQRSHQDIVSSMMPSLAKYELANTATKDADLSRSLSGLNLEPTTPPPALGGNIDNLPPMSFYS